MLVPAFYVTERRVAGVAPGSVNLQLEQVSSFLKLLEIPISDRSRARIHTGDGCQCVMRSCSNALRVRSIAVWQAGENCRDVSTRFGVVRSSVVKPMDRHTKQIACRR